MSGSLLKVLENGVTCQVTGLLEDDTSEPRVVVAKSSPSEVGPGSGLETRSSFGWVLSGQAVRMGWEAVPVAAV